MYADLSSRGFKPENIIYMSFTSSFTTLLNPFRNMIFTDSEETTDGDWAKYGCVANIDYTGKDINKEVFLAILSGDAETVKAKTGKENPKVLAAGPEDTVFTYFIDHGGDDIIVVGGNYVHSKDLLGALETAYNKKIYGKWVWFMEACHSGSMFTKLPDNWNIFVMTSSDPHHNANMSNCPPDDVVAGKELNCCIAGLWDNSYLDYMEANPDCTIGEIVDAVAEDVAKTSNQGVSHYGDMSFRDMKLAEFVGYPKKTLRSEKKTTGTTVSVADVPAHLAKWRAIRGEEAAVAEYQEIVFAEAKKEVEVMRLGAKLLGEKAADKAMKLTASNYAVSCVRDLSISLVEKCGHSFPLSNSAVNMLRNICVPGAATPNVDFSDICL